ncbi:MAG: ribonuclease J [Candidatus Pacebacteria bacterium]|nr:ribonuclease J [Candidatus Paceibacterota bacterium]
MEPQTNPPAPRAESASNNRRPSTRRYVKRVAPQSSTTTNNTAAPNSEQSQPSHIRKNNRRGNRTRTGNNSETERAPRTKRGNSVKNDREIEDLKSIPPLAPGDIRIVPVCGVEWITTNMTFVEYMDEIIVIDAGLGFSNPSTPGIDYTIPNTTYLKANQHKIKALVITHGHLDHVGAIPFVIKDLGNPPIYTREFGALFIKKKLEEFPQLPPVNIQTIDEHTGYTKLSENFKVKFFGLTHSIPDSSGVILQTPLGGIVSTGDVRVENENGVINEKEIAQYAHFKDEKILLLTMDSTGIEKPGWTISERIVIENVDKIVKETTGGRLFIAAFSSQVERLMSFMESAQKHGKYIALEGRSMKSNLGIAEFLNLTDFKHVIPIEKIDDYPRNKVVVLLTGSQGEEFAALSRMSKGSHKTLKLHDTDTILLSASVVPGNDYDVAQLKNRLYRGSYNIITYNDDQVHASGHGTRAELKWIHSQIKYKFFMPIHGEPYMIRMHAKMAERELGIPAENIVVPDNGSIIEIREQGNKIVKLTEKIPADPRIVEGMKVKEKQEVVFRDRQALAADGIFIIVVAFDPKTGRVKKSPDIISRGFIYLRDNQHILQDVRDMVTTITEKTAASQKQLDFDKIKQNINDGISKFLKRSTHKNPMVISVVLGL